MSINENVVSGLVSVFWFTSLYINRSTTGPGERKRYMGNFKQHTTYNGTTALFPSKEKKIKKKINIQKKTSEKKVILPLPLPGYFRTLQNLGFGVPPSRGKAKKLDHRTTPGQVHPPPDPTWKIQNTQKSWGSQQLAILFVPKIKNKNKKHGIYIYIY